MKRWKRGWKRDGIWEKREGVRTGLGGGESSVGGGGQSGVDALELVLVDGGAFFGSSGLGCGEGLELSLSLEIALNLFGVAVLSSRRDGVSSSC